MRRLRGRGWMSRTNDVLTAPSGTRVRSYGKALVTNYALTIVNMATYVLAVPWYVRWLGTDRFGIWLILLQFLYTASLVTMWIAAPLTRKAADCYIRQDSADLARVFQTASGYYGAWGILMLAAVTLGSSVVLKLLHLDAAMGVETRMALLVVTVSFGVSMQLNVLLSLLVGYQRMHYSNLLQAGSTVASTVVGLLLVYRGAGVVGVAAGQLIGNCGAYAIAFLLLERTASARLAGFTFDRAVLRDLLRTGSNYLGYCVSYLLLQSDTMLVGFTLGVRAAAIYGLAFRVADQMVQLIWRIPDAMFPVTSELAARQELTLFRPAYRLASKLSLAVAVFAAAMLVFLGRPVLTLWVGRDNVAAPQVLVALAGALIMQVFVHNNVIVPFGASRMKGIAIAAVLEALLKIGLALVLLPRIGMAGAAAATIVAQVLCTGWYATVVACRITEETVGGYVRGVVAPSLVVSAGLAACLWIVAQRVPPGVGQSIVGIVGGVATSALIFLTMGLQSEERRWVGGVLARLVGGEPSAHHTAI
jgi:O-antigen/teichoic acid export membrane protein